MSRKSVFLTAMIGLSLMSLTHAATLSAQNAPKVIVKTVSATFPAKVTIVTWQLGVGETRNAKLPASGEKWLVVKAIPGAGTDWIGNSVNGAVVRDTSGKKYSAISVGVSESSEPEFYANAFSLQSHTTYAMFLFSISANSKGLKFSYGGGTEFPIP
jgi:hypothetical protein